jgi:hypothetical protein
MGWVLITRSNILHSNGKNGFYSMLLHSMDIFLRENTIFKTTKRIHIPHTSGTGINELAFC